MSPGYCAETTRSRLTHQLANTGLMVIPWRGSLLRATAVRIFNAVKSRSPFFRNSEGRVKLLKATALPSPSRHERDAPNSDTIEVRAKSDYTGRSSLKDMKTGAHGSINQSCNADGPTD